jgi:hypothetical protein
MCRGDSWTNGLPRGDAEDLGGETDGSLDAEVLVLGTVDEIRADCRRGTIIVSAASLVDLSLRCLGV